MTCIEADAPLESPISATPTLIAITRKVDLAIRTVRIEVRDSFSASFLCFNFQESGVASNDLPSPISPTFSAISHRHSLRVAIIPVSVLHRPRGIQHSLDAEWTIVSSAQQRHGVPTSAGK